MYVPSSSASSPIPSTSISLLLSLRPRAITNKTPDPADFIQDLYVKELKAYKTPAVKATDSEGHVQKWAAPKAPKSPEETDIANELKAYEASSVDVEGQAEGGVVDSGDNWFEEEPEVEEKH